MVILHMSLIATVCLGSVYLIPSSADKSFTGIKSKQVPQYSVPSREMVPPVYSISKVDTNYYESQPQPSEELQPPVETSWNSERNPLYYYDDTQKNHYGLNLDAISSQVPTDQFPKKYIRTVFVNDEKKQTINPSLNIINDSKKIYKVEKIANKKKILSKVLASKYRNDKPQTNPIGLESAPSIADLLMLALPKRIDSAHDKNGSGIPETDKRVNFHTVGRNGPHSYEWGYDTGLGENRQFRYEEKDNDGIVKGHYGYYNNGKLKMVNYQSQPNEGYHAAGDFGRV